MLGKNIPLGGCKWYQRLSATYHRAYCKTNLHSVKLLRLYITFLRLRDTSGKSSHHTRLHTFPNPVATNLTRFGLDPPQTHSWTLWKRPWCGIGHSRLTTLPLSEICFLPSLPFTTKVPTQFNLLTQSVKWCCRSTNQIGISRPHCKLH